MNRTVYTDAVPSLKGHHWTRAHPTLAAGPAAVYAWADEQAAAIIARRREARREAGEFSDVEVLAPASTVPCPECSGRGWTGDGRAWADTCDNPGCRLGRIPVEYITNPPCPICRGDGAVGRPGLRIGDPAFGRAEPCSCPRDVVTAGGDGPVNRFALAAAGMPAKYHGMTLSTWYARVADGQGAEYDRAGQLARALMGGRMAEVTMDRHGLLIMGATGRGKSGLAAGVFQEFVAAGRVARWIPFGSYCDALNAERNAGGNDRDTLRRDIGAQFLVIDDLGSEGKATDHRTRVLLEILEGRAGRPTIITTMHGHNHLSELYGDHNIGRIVEGFEPVTLGGRDARTQSR